MKRCLVLCFSILTLLLMVPGTGISADPEKSGKSPQKAPGAPPQAMYDISGKVLEAMDSGGYTYMKIEKDGKKMWVATPLMKVAVGQNVSLQPGMVMTDFQSKTLGRTFESIVFSGGPVVQPNKESAGKSDSKQAAVPKAIKVNKASGPDAYTVAELYEKSAKLKTKKVVLNGQVVKFSSQIMKKNWAHIQDGSGDASKGTNDIIVTTKDVVEIGDVVTVKGTLSTDKDFGGGYKYSVLVEDASIKK